MNSELLYITRKLGYPSSFGTRSGLVDFLEKYPDGVYAENGGGAPMGWESAAVWFGGDSERTAARFERMMSERNELSRLFRTRVAGVLVLTFIYRLKSRMVTAIPISGAQPHPVIDPTWINFTMPNGGTVTLTKNGTPTAVTLEYSLDNGNTWTEWVVTGNARSLALAAGQTIHIRNTSETSTGFSTSTTNFYYFTFNSNSCVGGNVNSLLCKIPQNAVITDFCYYCLFRSCTNLIMSDTFALPSTTLATRCYSYMFTGCVNLNISNTFILPATTLANLCYYRMFYSCRNVDLIRTNMTDISATDCIANWLLDVAANGDFYCPAELTIPTGVSGIPSGWTRHDI